MRRLSLSNNIEAFCEQLLLALDTKLAGKFGETQELALIKLLQQPPYQLFESDALHSDLNLFQTHFLLYHSLYLLRDKWLTEQYAVIDIQLSKIFVYPYENRPVDLPAVDDQLRNYYSDLSNVDISQRDVEKLLRSFWEKFLKAGSLNDEKVVAAYEHLELSKTCTDQVLKKRIKALSLIHHPDKGGEQAIFRSYIEAYEVIKAHRQYGSTHFKA